MCTGWMIHPGMALIKVQLCLTELHPQSLVSTDVLLRKCQSIVVSPCERQETRGKKKGI